MKGGSKVVVQPHRHDGVFVAKGKEDALCTKNMVSGESVYGEKRVSVQVTLLSTFIDVCGSRMILRCQSLSFFLTKLFLFCRMRMERKLNTGCGTPFARSWQQPFLVVSTIYGL